jgi:hypothetical protein
MLWVTISKKWHQPVVYASITRDDGVEMSLPLDDFIEALRQEIGSVTWTVTEAQFKARVKAAVTNVVEGIKAESVKYVGGY